MPISKDNSRAQAAYLEIKQRLMSGAFAPGARLREVEVAEMLDLGRTPVREALKRIQDEGLIRHQPGHGLVVATTDVQEVGELYAMREVLEATAAAGAARYASDAEILHIEGILDEGAAEDPVALNHRFHEAIYSAAHNRYLLRLLRTLTDTTYLLGRSTLSDPQRAELAMKEHRAIAAAIRQRDPELATQAAREHISHALRERLKMLRAQSALPRTPNA